MNDTTWTGENIRALRLRLKGTALGGGMTQMDLAIALGVKSLPTISRRENNVGTISEQLAGALDQLAKDNGCDDLLVG